MDLFQSPPVISRESHRGIWVEGVVPDANTGATFSLAVTTLGHLVPRSAQMTGAQWIDAIRKQYDTEEPRNKMMVSAIKTVMLVDRFADDHVALEMGRAVFRGTAAMCAYMGKSGACDIVPVATVSADVVAQADLQVKLQYMEEVFDGEVAHVPKTDARVSMLEGGGAKSLGALGFPEEYVYIPEGDAKEDPLARGLELLDVGAMNGEFSTEQDGDAPAAFAVMGAMVKLLGYEALISYGRSGGHHGGAPKAPPVTPERVAQSMGGFLGSLLDGEWDEQSKVFLCRPAPLVGPFLTMRRNEALVHERLIGWRVPAGVVRHVVEDIRQKRCEEVAFRPGERA